MLRVPLSNPSLKRTLRPLYANHQATTWGGFLDPEYDSTVSGEIYPGTVMKRTTGDIFTVYDGTSGSPFGLSALFVAPSLGVNEVTSSGTNLFTVWVGNQDAVFEILAPAFNTAATWPEPNSDAPPELLGVNDKGQLQPGGGPDSIAELVDIVSENKIIVRLRQPGAATP